MTTPQPAALLQCPHCGKTDTLKVISASDFWDDTEDAPYMHTETYGVFCDASRPDGPGGCGASSGFKETAQQAIETWNTRTALAALQPAEVSDAEIDALSWHLEAVREYEAHTGQERLVVEGYKDFARAILALRLAQHATPEPVGEPVAWRYKIPTHGGGAAWTHTRPQPECLIEAQPLYTHPAPGVPDGSALFMRALLQWAVGRWQAEVQDRPMVNKNRRTLDDTWRQVIRFAGGNPDALVGPSHDDALAAAQAKGGA